MTVSEGPQKIGGRVLNTNYPITEGLELGTTKLPEKIGNSWYPEIDGRKDSEVDLL